ncbi:MAG: T9SS type A sorting domain-containing protein [Ignavibacteriales bacterium]|nr:T9SS type A sorting domain-containing protein [Ignavibacteriales bacterium]
MRRLFGIFLVLLALVAVSLGQSTKYGYAGPFPADSNAYKLIGGVINVGIGVDPAGKVWIQTRSENTTRDSITTAEGTKARLFPILAFNPNGTQASFSPITILSSGGVTDTLIRSGSTGGNINHSNGNFVAVWGSLAYKPGPLIWEIDYKTGQGAKRFLLSPVGGVNVLQNNIASVDVNNDGEYFICSVLGGTPGMILNPDGSQGTQFSSSVPAIGRAIAVSRNGNNVYVPRFTDWKTYVYESSAGTIGPYALKDSIFLGAGVEAIAVHPTTGHIWAVAGNNSSNTYTPNTAYAYNPTTKAVVDSFHISAWDEFLPAPTSLLPRGLAFSPTGDTVYVGHFNATAVPAVIRFIKGFGVSVERDDNIVPTGYTLSQNFPNPFNPSTKIQFEIASAGVTTLKVYDLMGREVSTLVNRMMEAGSYTATFDAARLPSGTYVYVLTSGAQRLSGKMMLLK